jgi:3-hydroxyacyl-CoA dehydrogenase
MTRVAVIGSGFVGRAWAISFARAGSEVVLWDQDKDAPSKALAYIERLLPDLEANDLLNGTPAGEVAARIRVAATLESALEGAVHIQENTPEDVEVKRAVFAQLDTLAPPDVVLASSTSAILPSSSTEGLEGRARCLVVHPINPPYLIPAAEIVPAPWTDPSVVKRAARFLRAAGHTPIVMKREIDGFVMNRLQGALLEEAFRLVDQGYAEVEDIDVGIRDGLALRWSFMGPFETIDLNAPAGVRDYADRYQGIYSGIFRSSQWRVDWSGLVMDIVESERRKAWQRTGSENARLGGIAA